MAAETDTLSEYELERIKRVKANQEVLMSLGIENSLPKLRRRYRKRQQNQPVVREADNTQLDLLVRGYTVRCPKGGWKR